MNCNIFRYLSKISCKTRIEKLMNVLNNKFVILRIDLTAKNLLISLKFPHFHNK